jgi:hypothetical protein
MPVTGMTGRESPSDRFEGNAILDVTIPGYVNIVVVIIEIAMRDRPEGYEGSRRQKKVNQ